MAEILIVLSRFDKLEERKGDYIVIGKYRIKDVSKRYSIIFGSGEKARIRTYLDNEVVRIGGGILSRYSFDPYVSGKQAIIELRKGVLSYEDIGKNCSWHSGRGNVMRKGHWEADDPLYVGGTMGNYVSLDGITSDEFVRRFRLHWEG
jgi:hypothetical protein